MSFGYRIELTPDDNDTLLVTCPAIPELTTFGVDEADAMAQAGPALDEAIAGRIAAGRDIPDFESGDGALATLPALSALKVRLYLELRCQGVTRAELARRLNWHREQVDRLFRLDHASRLDQIHEAFRAVHRDIDFKVVVGPAQGERASGGDDADRSTRTEEIRDTQASLRRSGRGIRRRTPVAEA